jgi:monofunctional biosynthetic peptidoglycan transglycosylase
MTLKKMIKHLFLTIVLVASMVQLWFFSNVLWLQHVNPKQTAFMSARLNTLRAENPDAKLRYQWVNDDQISNNLKRAVIAAEDSLFFAHQGFDWKSLKQAWHSNQKNGAKIRGGSTITQQLAKNLFLSADRSFVRKGQEALITLMIESTMSKKRILEIYLNVIEWGDGIYGAEAASQHYYHKSARQLTANQAAKLAAMIPRPRFYDANRETRALSKKTSIIQRRMRHISIPE